MASVTVQKWGLQAALSGQVSHLYREHEHYGNEDVDVSRSCQNLYYGTADECRAALKKTVAEIDARIPPQRLKKDRKTVYELNFPAPREGMTRQDAESFLDALYERLDETYHICGGVIHEDEVHEYVDPDSGSRKTSRLHLQVLGVPETDRGCNMSSWLTRARFRELNAVADEVCREIFGYTYQDGSRQKSRGSVERMKTRSAVAERAAAEKNLEIASSALDEANRELYDARAAADREREQVKKLSDRKKDAARRLDALTADVELQQAKLSEHVERARRHAADVVDAAAAIDVTPLEELPAVEKTAFRPAKPERVVLARADYDALVKGASARSIAERIATKMNAAAVRLERAAAEIRSTAYRTIAEYEDNFVTECQNRVEAAEIDAETAQARLYALSAAEKVGLWLYEHARSRFEKFYETATGHAFHAWKPAEELPPPEPDRWLEPPSQDAPDDWEL